MLVIDASVLVDALLVAGPARARLASENLQAPELIAGRAARCAPAHRRCMPRQGAGGLRCVVEVAWA
jgi:hypothetical protein